MFYSNNYNDVAQYPALQMGLYNLLWQPKINDTVI